MQNGNGKGGGGNQWLLSRSLPIDVRLLVAALAAGGGALTYLYYDRVSPRLASSPSICTTLAYPIRE